MSTALITVEGVEEVQRLLRDAPKVIVAQAYFRALQAAIGVMRTEMELRIPYSGNSMAGKTARTGIGNAVHAGRGALRENVVTDIQIDSQLRGGFAEVGFSPGTDIVGRWVEYGHRMVGHKPGKKLLGQVPPHPFMRPATIAGADAAIAAFAETFVRILKPDSWTKMNPGRM